MSWMIKLVMFLMPVIVSVPATWTYSESAAVSHLAPNALYLSKSLSLTTGIDTSVNEARLSMAGESGRNVSKGDV